MEIVEGLPLLILVVTLSGLAAFVAYRVVSRRDKQEGAEALLEVLEEAVRDYARTQTLEGVWRSHYNSLSDAFGMEEFSRAQASEALGLSPSRTSAVLQRLAAAGRAERVRRGVWRLS